MTKIRNKIPIDTVFDSIHEENGKKTGILEVASFSQTTSEEFFNALDDMEKDGIDGLIIDVRGNPGGLLKSIEVILQEFIPKDVPYIITEYRYTVKPNVYYNL